MAYQVADVQTLITQGNLVDITNINPNIAYVNIGYFQRGQRRSGNASSAYRQFAINLQSIINAAPGTPIAVKDEGLLVSNNILSLDFRGANVQAILDPFDPTNRSVIVNVTGGGGGGGTVTAVGASNGLSLDPLGTPASPTVQLGTNPLLFNTTIPSNTFNLSLTGTGKYGVGVDVSTVGGAAKSQVRTNAGAFGITGTVTGTTLTVTNPLPFGSNYVGTINIGDYLFAYGASGIKWGTYITGNPSPGVYSLNQAVTGTITATGQVTSNAGLFTPNQIVLNTVPLGLKVEKATGAGNVLESWYDGSMRVTGSVSRVINAAGGFILDYTPEKAIIYRANTNTLAVSRTANTSDPLSEYANLTSNAVCAERATILTDVHLGGGNFSGVYNGGLIQFNRSGFSQINSIVAPGGITPSYDLNYHSSRHRFTGPTAVSSSSDLFGPLPSAFGGADYSGAVNGGARAGYSLCVYQPLNGTVSYSITGYIIGTQLFVVGCNASGNLPAGWLQPGHALSGRTFTNPSGGILEGTTISAIVQPWDPGINPPPNTACVTDQIGIYDLLVNGVATPQTFASAGTPLSITGSAYPVWNNTRAMYVDGTIKFKNLPQGTGPAPQSPPAGLTTGDIWHDTSDNTIKIVV